MLSAISQRRFVSYIDKSREFYRAQGYTLPYRWARFDEVPFTELARPLGECRVGLVTTADTGGRDAPRASKLFAAPSAAPPPLFVDKAWDRDATHMDDLETFLPISALNACVEQGMLASASPRFYGVPTDYSQRRTLEEDAPRLESWLREDAVDAVVLVPI